MAPLPTTRVITNALASAARSASTTLGAVVNVLSVIWNLSPARRLRFVSFLCILGHRLVLMFVLVLCREMLHHHQHPAYTLYELFFLAMVRSSFSWQKQLLMGWIDSPCFVLGSLALDLWRSNELFGGTLYDWRRHDDGLTLMVGAYCGYALDSQSITSSFIVLMLIVDVWT